MKTYLVTVQVTVERVYRIKANTEEQAKERVRRFDPHGELEEELDTEEEQIQSVELSEEE